MQVVDLAWLAGVAREAGAQLVVDGTFATPALQRPLELGAGAVLHSTTKYLGGHSDVQGGALVFARRDEQSERVAHLRKVTGGVASPFNSWLVLRGLRSLDCRVERQSANALAVARALVGGMLSFEVRGGREPAIAVASRLKLFVVATSLGGVESTIEHRASSEGPQSPTPPALLRASIGLEHPDDLIADLFQALD
jgi:cystathionine gamma-synthase